MLPARHYAAAMMPTLPLLILLPPPYAYDATRASKMMMDIASLPRFADMMPPPC